MSTTLCNAVSCIILSFIMNVLDYIGSYIYNGRTGRSSIYCSDYCNQVNNNKYKKVTHVEISIML